MPTGAIQSGSQLPELSGEEFARFQALVQEQTGIRLRENKRHLLVARLAHHLHTLGLASFAEYYERVVEDESGVELKEFINRMTTNKTAFFREPYHFEYLRTRLIPAVQRAGPRPLRIWSAACSSGEEPYSIAIAVREALTPALAAQTRILATDIDTEMLELAEAGVYPLEALDPVPVHQQRAHFLKGYGEYEGFARVRPEVQRMVEFRRLNFMQADWGVHARYDAIFCRNVIIYFDQELQKALVTRLAGHLSPEGCYFSGHSENLHWLGDILAPLEPTIYRLKGAAAGPGASTGARRDTPEGRGRAR